MEQVNKIEFKVRGAGGDDIFDGPDMSQAIWGDRANDPNSGLVAFAYLWRRFGPPWRGSDEYKDLASYTLTTSAPRVFLRIYPNGCSLAFSIAYIMCMEMRRAANETIDLADHTQYTGIVRNVNRALYDAMKELERPVYIRDCPINILGRCDEATDEFPAAKWSKYAGYGVPKAAMDNYFTEKESKKNHG